MCMRFYINYSIQTREDLIERPGARPKNPRTRPEVLRLSLHSNRDGGAVELQPCNLNGIYDSCWDVDENRRPHADLQRPRSDDSGLLKSRVAHRGSLAPGRGRRCGRVKGRDGRRAGMGASTSTLASAPLLWHRRTPRLLPRIPPA